MANGNGPLGRYSTGVAAFIAVVLVVSCIALRVVGIRDPFIDNLALIAIGAVFGASAATHVNGGRIEAAHRRLDIIAAPPADTLEQAAISEMRGES